MAAPIQTQWNGDEINFDIPKWNEKVPIRRAKGVFVDRRQVGTF